MTYDVEELILEVSVEDSIWNIKAKEYHDKVAKHVSWVKVATAVLKNFETLEETDKQKQIIILQKKWKNLKDTYRRKCITKSGQAANKIKKYIYSDILEFLKPTMDNRRTEGNFNDDTDDDINGIEDDAEDEEQANEEVEKEVEEESPSIKPRLGTLKSKKYDQKMSPFENQLVDLMKKKESDNDPDKLFLLSLLPKFKLLNEDQKLNAQIEMLNIFQKIKNPQPAPSAPIQHGQHFSIPNIQPLHPSLVNSYVQNPSSHPIYTQTYSNYPAPNSQNCHSPYDDNGSQNM